ncbi:MAG: dihydropteroate synthase [Puniceicoccaceae bacterium]|jgi:dihydropteroate synthase|nr:dihydropteroate synthase [Puniceicoccaceae bacterium]MBL6837570.1 dihydropteroate synthase [Puniceicoccaceae bacterium]MBL6913239.1 dihydropteroate synthase [Puniceicoccaceae bacterium]
MKERIYHTPRKALPLGRRTYLVGILNLTPDSFSDGGDFVDHDAAALHFHSMLSAGADLIDIGGESTRPGHVPIPVPEEIARVVPFIEKIRPHTDALISIDTSKAEVAEAALAVGADIVNDVWGAQRDPRMAEVIGASGSSCILMHNRPAEEAGVGDVMEAVLSFLQKSIRLVKAAGLRDDAIILDPGLGFGKSYEENWAIMRRLPELCDLGYPVLLGASRKSMIAKLLDLKDPKARLSGTLATTALGIQAGVDFVRVHDVRENRECADVVDHCMRAWAPL